MIRRGAILAGLSIAALLGWFFLHPRNDDRPESAKSQSPQPGYYMTDAKITETGTDGLPLYRMSAQRIQQNPADQSIRLDKLRFIYSTEDANDWTLTANTGVVKSLDAKIVDLQDDVRIVGRPKSASTHPPAVIRTSRLRVDAVTSTATTQERADIEWGSCRLNGTGLKVDLKKKTLKLNSRIHGNCI